MWFLIQSSADGVMVNRDSEVQKVNGMLSGGAVPGKVTEGKSAHKGIPTGIVDGWIRVSDPNAKDIVNVSFVEEDTIIEGGNCS